MTEDSNMIFHPQRRTEIGSKVDRFKNLRVNFSQFSCKQNKISGSFRNRDTTVLKFTVAASLYFKLASHLYHENSCFVMDLKIA